MSILIRSMEMPTSCGKCKIKNAIECNRWKLVRSVALDRHKDCPICTVPPHGRLGDLDAMIEDLKYDVELDAAALDSMEIVGDERRKIQDDKDFKQNCIFWIDNAPTVIEADHFGEVTEMVNAEEGKHEP